MFILSCEVMCCVISSVYLSSSSSSLSPPISSVDGPNRRGDVETGGGGAWRINQKVPADAIDSPLGAGGTGAYPEEGGDDIPGTPGRQEIIRNTSYMPRHHKSEASEG